MNGFNVQGTDLVKALDGFLLRIYGHRTSEILVLVHVHVHVHAAKGQCLSSELVVRVLRQKQGLTSTNKLKLE